MVEITHQDVRRAFPLLPLSLASGVDLVPLPFPAGTLAILIFGCWWVGDRIGYEINRRRYET